MRMRALVVAASAGALLLAGCTTPSTEPAPVQSAATDSASPEGEVAEAATPIGDVRPWQAGPVPAAQADGPTFPEVWPASEVVGSGSATSRAPKLRVKDVSGDVEVEVVDVSAGGGFGLDGQGDPTELVWSGSAPADSIELPTAPPVLRQGGTYAYRVKKGADWLGPWSFTVDEIRQGVAPTDTFAGIQVNLLTGVPATSWATRAFARPSGALRVGLRYRPGSAAAPGLAQDWSWSLPGSGLMQLAESEVQAGSGDSAGPQSVRLMTADGGGPTFVRTPTGAYVPGLSDGTAAQYAQAGTLVPLGQGQWSFTAPDGTLTEFTGGRITAEWLGGVPIARYTWGDDGRLLSVSDGIEGGQTIGVSYGDGCEGGSWAGFSAPAELVCAFTYPDGTSSQLAYVEAAGAPRLAMAVDPGGVGVGWGWDGSGRLASARSTAATSMAAISQDWASPEFTTEIAYDANGRVASVTDMAAAKGADRIRHSYEYPSGGDLQARVLQSTVTNGTATPVESTLGGGAVVEVRADNATWKVTERRGVDGRAARVVYDEATGVVSEGRSTDGRSVVMKSDQEGLLTSSIGPFLGDQSGALRTDRTLDSAIVEPGAGAASAAEAWTGLAAIVWPQGGSGVPAWWDASTFTDGLRASFDGAPVAGSPAKPWRAQATGLWRVRDAGTYTFEIESGEGTRVALVIDGVQCTGVVGDAGCRMRLADGEHNVLVTIDVTDGKGEGAFRIRAGGDGDVRDIAVADLRPNYNFATRVVTNDSVSGEEFGADVILTDRPWTGRPDSVVTAGGRTTTYDYESTDGSATGLGRLTSTRTPGGSTMSATYYSMGESATDPCTGAQFAQAGLLKTITRYDGVTITTVYDVTGRPIAVTTQGDGMSQLVCTTYDAAGRVVASSSRDESGAVLEEATTSTTVRDGLFTTTTTTTLGPAAPEGAGESFTSTQVLDALGRSVEVVDASGTVARFAYGPDGSLVRRDLWSPKADRSGTPTLTLDFTYDAQTAQPVSIQANGTKMAQARYGEGGQLLSIDYANDVRMELRYDTAGSVSAVQVAAADRVYLSERDRNPMGRSLSSTLTVDEGGKKLTRESWSYSYDDAGRLSKAVLTTDGDDADTGGPKRTFGYDYGAAPDGCFAGAGANLDRVGGSRDGVDFEVCRDDRGRLRWTTDPHLTGGADKAQATYDGLGRMTALSGAVPLELTWGPGTQVASITQGDTSSSMVVAGGAVQRMTHVEGGVTTDTRYGYAGAASPVFVLAADGTVLDTRLSLPGGVIASLGPEPLASPTRLQFPDAFGAALASTVDGVPTGTTPSALAPRFGPFGEPLVTRTPVTTYDSGMGPGTDYGFQAIAANPTVVGQHDLTISARPYHPWLGEFLASDPSPGASTTAYGYGEATPVDSPDFSGGWSMWDTIGVVGAAFAVIGGVSSGYVASGAYGKTAQVLAVTAMVGGMSAAIAGSTMSWVEGDNSWVSAGVTVAAVIGLVFTGIGLHDWSVTVEGRFRQLTNVVDDVASMADPKALGLSTVQEQPREFLRLGTGVQGVEIKLVSVRGVGTVATYVGEGIVSPIRIGSDALEEGMGEAFIMQGEAHGLVNPDASVQLLNLLQTFWDGA